MNQRRTASSLALAGVLLAVGWSISTPSADRVDAPNTASFSREGAPNAQTYSAPDATTSVFARASGATQSPFGAILSLSDNEPPRKQFEQLLQDYRAGELSPEEKVRIKQTLLDLKQDPVARTFIIETFFSSDKPELAESLYGLVRDADLKDVGLIEGLIQRDGKAPTTSFKGRIVDLIADLSTKKDVPYSAVIDGYLAQAALNPDATLRNAAASQRMWYLAQHQPNNLAAVEKYILDSAPTVREEAYSLLESRMASQTLAGQAKLVPTLNAALQSDHLGVSAEEKARVGALLATLTGSGASL